VVALMKFEFAGSPTIDAPRERVWARLIDPHFLAQSAPGVESVETIDSTHFKVLSGLGVGSIRVRLTMDVELYDIEPGRSAKMRMHGQAAGSAIDVVSDMRIVTAGPASTQLSWSATCQVSGAVASIGARLMEGAARRLTEQFWTDFARRVSQER
jgi:carbon monoxide dehydrogenase subunit G